MAIFNSYVKLPEGNHYKPPTFHPFPISFEASRDFLEDKAVSTSTTLSPFEVKRLSVMAIKLFTKAWRLAMKTWEKNGDFMGNVHVIPPGKST
jgi:hypothetical protein